MADNKCCVLSYLAMNASEVGVDLDLVRSASLPFRGQVTKPIVRTFPHRSKICLKKTVSSITFLNCPRVKSLLYVFRKERHSLQLFLFLLGPTFSNLDLINIISSTYLDS